MCFSSPSAPTTPTPAAAPPPPSLPAEQEQIGSVAKRQNTSTYGNPNGPTTRVDRSTDTSLKGGSGLNM